jgi:peptidoglycan glycosyltransferase
MLGGAKGVFRMKQNIYKVALFFFGLYFILILSLIYINQFESEMLTTHPKNRRIWELEAETIRGGIFARNGEILARTTEDHTRVYPQKEYTAHLVGYSSVRFGKTGLEDRYDGYLLGTIGTQKYINYFRRLAGKAPEGHNLLLTLDLNMQKVALDMLAGRRGAVVAINPQNGAVLALASSPSFDANRLPESWDSLTNNDNSPLLNRALQGVYPPGSVLKIMVAAAALENNPDYWNQTFENPGYLEINGRRIHDTTVRTELTMKEGLAISSNVLFGSLALELGSDSLIQGFENFYFNKTIPFDLFIKRSSVPKANKLTKNALAELGIGQGETLITPLHMALITATIANDGIMYKPYLVEQIVSPQGALIKQGNSSILGQPITAETANLVTEGMVAVVEEGYGKNARIPGVSVAGKTGSAENPLGISHAWFVGFAPADNPQIAVAVVLENQGAGGTHAAPIARELFKLALGM